MNFDEYCNIDVAGLETDGTDTRMITSHPQKPVVVRLHFFVLVVSRLTSPLLHPGACFRCTIDNQIHPKIVPL